MKAPYQILLPLLSLFLVRVDLTDLIPLKIPVKIVKVYDGDTVLVRSHGTHFKVRIDKIDAPEKGQLTFAPRIDGGAFARKCLIKILDKDPHHVLKLRGYDMYQRVLGEINEASLELIQAGCVGLYPFARFRDKKEKGLFVREYFKSRREKRGLWAYGGFQRPGNYRSNKRNGYR